jgi:hypothetical protein
MTDRHKAIADAERFADRARDAAELLICERSL